jgi:hypothetical protein
MARKDLLTVGTVRQQCALEDAHQPVVVVVVSPLGAETFYAGRRAYPDTSMAPAGSGLYVVANETDKIGAHRERPMHFDLRGRLLCSPKEGGGGRLVMITSDPAEFAASDNRCPDCTLAKLAMPV